MSKDRCSECGQRLPSSRSNPLREAAHAMRASLGDAPAAPPARSAAPPEPAPMPPMPRLSHHALLRYLERVKGVDVEAVRREIMTKGVIDAIKGGATAIIIAGHKMPVSAEGTITTVYDRYMRVDSRRRFQKRRRPRIDEIAEYFEELAEELVGG